MPTKIFNFKSTITPGGNYSDNLPLSTVIKRVKSIKLLSAEIDVDTNTVYSYVNLYFPEFPIPVSNANGTNCTYKILLIEPAGSNGGGGLDSYAVLNTDNTYSNSINYYQNTTNSNEITINTNDNNNQPNITLTDNTNFNIMTGEIIQMSNTANNASILLANNDLNITDASSNNCLLSSTNLLFINSSNTTYGGFGNPSVELYFDPTTVLWLNNRYMTTCQGVLTLTNDITQLNLASLAPFCFMTVILINSSVSTNYTWDWNRTSEDGVDIYYSQNFYSNLTIDYGTTAIFSVYRTTNAAYINYLGVFD